MIDIWKKQATDDSDLIAELATLCTQDNYLKYYDRFHRDLSFGTGGLRGKLGAGTNRINIYTVRKATQGLSQYLLSSGLPLKVAIAYDSRIKSDLFAKESARVLAGNGISVYLYPRLMPTPALSFAVRYFGCGAGICITASHNPAEYNGYKVYGPDGCQITLMAAERIQSEIEKVDLFEGPILADFVESLDHGKIHLIEEDAVDAYLQAVLALQLSLDNETPLQVVYTPLNGAGLECVTRMLCDIHITDVTVVPEQKEPDGHFPTCPYPNPEERDALKKGLELCERIQPDLLLATDPDCDRVGIAVSADQRYQLMTGNEVGVLLLDYIGQQRTAAGTMPINPIAVKTIVTTDMAVAVGQKYGIAVWDVLTGFKFIGEQIGILESNGQLDRFVFGFEESYGYLSGTHARDKDAVNASMLICEMARYYKSQGKTLVDALQALYQEHGYYQTGLQSYSFEGADGLSNMQRIMAQLRATPPSSFAALRIKRVVDYQTGIPKSATQACALPPADVLEYRLQHNCKVTIRPSGTEPKMKIYLSVRGKSMDQAMQQLTSLESACATLLH